VTCPGGLSPPGDVLRVERVTDYDALLQAILYDPEDGAARLVYAD